MPERRSRTKNSLYYTYYRDGREVSVFEALATISCYRCGGKIVPGDLFSRSSSKNGRTPGIRYTFCSECEPFEKRPAKAMQEGKKFDVDEQEDILWSDLLGYELVQMSIDEHGNASIADQMGLPVSRSDAAWILHVVRRYLKLHSEEEIEEERLRRLENLDNTSSISVRKKRRKSSGYVYLISGGGYYKVGKTTNLQVRQKQIGLKVPFPVSVEHAARTNDIDCLESYWHERFAAKRINGEWFTLTEADIAEFKIQPDMDWQ